MKKVNEHSAENSEIIIAGGSNIKDLEKLKGMDILAIKTGKIIRLKILIGKIESRPIKYLYHKDTDEGRKIAKDVVKSLGGEVIENSDLHGIDCEHDFKYLGTFGDKKLFACEGCRSISDDGKTLKRKIEFGNVIVEDFGHTVGVTDKK